MKPLLATFVVATLLVAEAMLQGAEPARNLWVGVLQDDLLIPVGALVNGRWSFRNDADDAQREGLWEVEGKLPARWLPLGQELPRTWRARLFTGESRVLHIGGPLVHNQFNDEQRAVRTDSGLHLRDDWTGYYGVAVAGSVGVRLFTPVPEDKRQEVVRFLAAPAAKEARAAIKIYGASQAEDAKLWAAVTDEAIAAGDFTVEGMSSTTQRDGSVLYYVEQSSTPHPDCEVHVRATVLKVRSDGLRLTAIEAEPKCDNYINLEPLAILERAGAACWLNAWIAEDGFDYTLTKPGLRAAFDQSACGIK